ncbi:hypothetical protein LXL04_035262 [Taraxacum kok-saghyz]
MRIPKQINEITRLTVLSKKNYWSLGFPKRNHSPNKTVASASRGYPTILTDSSTDIVKKEVSATVEVSSIDPGRFNRVQEDLHKILLIDWLYHIIDRRPAAANVHQTLIHIDHYSPLKDRVDDHHLLIVGHDFWIPTVPEEIKPKEEAYCPSKEAIEEIYYTCM